MDVNTPFVTWACWIVAHNKCFIFVLGKNFAFYVSNSRYPQYAANIMTFAQVPCPA